jgi:hypothetical protein
MNYEIYRIGQLEQQMSFLFLLMWLSIFAKIIGYIYCKYINYYSSYNITRRFLNKNISNITYCLIGCGSGYTLNKIVKNTRETSEKLNNMPNTNNHKFDEIVNKMDDIKFKNVSEFNIGIDSIKNQMVNNLIWTIISTNSIPFIKLFLPSVWSLVVTLFSYSWIDQFINIFTGQEKEFLEKIRIEVCPHIQTEIIFDDLTSSSSTSTSSSSSSTSSSTSSRGLNIDETESLPSLHSSDIPSLPHSEMTFISGSPKRTDIKSTTSDEYEKCLQ